jgi:hypothetical protein
VSNKIHPGSNNDLEGGGETKVQISDMIDVKPNYTDSLRVISINNDAENTRRNFLINYIRTTKYTILSFIPLGLLYQFMRLSNCYFLLVTILQSIPAVSPLNPLTAIFPLLFVLTLSMAREGYEDYNRYEQDKAQNS